PQPAEAGLLDVGAEALELIEVALDGLAVGHPVDQAERLDRPGPAWHAFAARLDHRELEEVAGHVDHAGRVVHHDHPARADDRAQPAQALVVQRHVQVVGRDAAAGWTAGLDRLEGAAVGDTPAEVVDDLPERYPERHFHDAGVGHLAGQSEHLGAAALLGSDRRVPVAAVAHDGRDVGERLDVVDEGWLAPEPVRRGVGWAGARRPATALDRRDQRGLLAADVGARADAQVDPELERRVQDPRAQHALALRLVDGALEPLDGQRVLAADVDVALAGADRVAGDRHPLEHAVRVAVHDAAVHEGARVALVAVADDVLLGGLCAGDEPP